MFGKSKCNFLGEIWFFDWVFWCNKKVEFCNYVDCIWVDKRIDDLCFEKVGFLVIYDFVDC